MKKLAPLAPFALLVLPAPACQSTDSAPSTFTAEELEIRAEDIQAHVDYLASDELEGRSSGSAAGRVAAGYIRDRFKEYGLEPLGDDNSYFQACEDLSPNVVGILRGTGTAHVIIGAHYDHIAPNQDAAEGEDRIYNGADDNASGVAALLELAQAFGNLEEPPANSIVLIAFMGEELDMKGSKYFVANAPFELKSILGVYNLDMISRGEENLIFCENGPKVPRMLAGIREANAEVGLDIRYDFHEEWIIASDHYSFIVKGVPALYFGVEDHEDYHSVTDHADLILPELAARVARLLYLAAQDLAADGLPGDSKR